MLPLRSTKWRDAAVDKLRPKEATCEVLLRPNQIREEMNTTTKVILGIIAAIAAYWLVSSVLSFVGFLLPFIIVAGIGYVVYRFSTGKGLPGSTRKPLP